MYIYIYIYIYVFMYILYIWYMRCMIYIYIWYGIVDAGIRDILYIYGTDIYGEQLNIQCWTILYQFWNMFHHFKFVFT